jgi:hypothetical protein
MTKYVIGVIAGVALLLILTYFAGVWSEKAASELEGPDMAGGRIEQEGSKTAKRQQKKVEEDQEEEEEPEPTGPPPPVPEYPYKPDEETAALIAKLESSITFEADGLSLEEALEEIEVLTGIEIDMDERVLGEAFPVYYKTNGAPVRSVLRDILATAGASYWWGKRGVLRVVPRDYLLRVTSAKGPLFALDMAREQFLREKAQENEWLTEELTLTGTPSEILHKLMKDKGIIPSKKALAAAAEMKDSVDLSASASEDILTFLQQNLNLEMPRGRADYPLKLIGTTDEVAEWDRRLEDYSYAREDFGRKQLEGEITNVQLYQLVKIISEKTGTQVVVDEEAWKYEEPISFDEGEIPTMRDVLEVFKEAGFTSILLIDEQTRQERLFIFKKQ